MLQEGLSEGAGWGKHSPFESELCTRRRCHRNPVESRGREDRQRVGSALTPPAQQTNVRCCSEAPRTARWPLHAPIAQLLVLVCGVSQGVPRG